MTRAPLMRRAGDLVAARALPVNGDKVIIYTTDTASDGVDNPWDAA